MAADSRPPVSLHGSFASASAIAGASGSSCDPAPGVGIAGGAASSGGAGGGTGAGTTSGGSNVSDLRSRRAEADLGPVCLDARLHPAHGGGGGGAGAQRGMGEDPEAEEFAAVRPRPLSPDFDHALASATQAEASLGGTEGLSLLLQVRPDKERVLGWRPTAHWREDEIAQPAGRQSASSSGARSDDAGSRPSKGSNSSARAVPPEQLARMTLSLQIPLLLARIRAIQFPRGGLLGGGALDPGGEGAGGACPSRPYGGHDAAAADGADEGIPGVAIMTAAPSEALSALQALKLGKEAGDCDAGTWLIVCESADDQKDILEQLQLAGCIMHDIGSRYGVGELVGVGASSKVFLAEDCSTAEEVAVKIVSKKTLKDDIALFKEATILRWAIHENVLQFRAMYEIDEPSTGQAAWAIVTEFIGGGELFEEVRQNGPLTEARTLNVIGQLLSALDFLHTRGIVHRDIKTENVCKTGYADEIKLVDFGLATPEWDHVAMLTRCGTPGYIAPEVLKGERYGCKVDCFSVGVLMYILLVGYGPFRGQTLEEMLLRNAKCKVNLQGLEHCSDEAKDLVSKLLVSKAWNRPTAQEGLEHPWAKPWVTANLTLSGSRVATPDGAQPPQPPDHMQMQMETSSGSDMRRERRRLFSVQLGCMDMFFHNLKFDTPEAAEYEVDGANGGAGGAEAVAPPPSHMTQGDAQAPPLSHQMSNQLSSGDGSCVAVPSIGHVPCGHTLSTGSQPAPPPHPPPMLSRPSYDGQQAPLPNTVDHSCSGTTSPRSPTGADGDHGPGAQHDVEDRHEQSDDDEEPARITVDMCRTCEPLWAGVQRTLENKKGQGILPAAAGLKNIALRRRYADIVRGKAEVANEEEVQRASAYFTRDFRKQQSLSLSDMAQERTSAFYMRDLRRQEDTASSGSWGQPSGGAVDCWGPDRNERRTVSGASGASPLRTVTVAVPEADAAVQAPSMCSLPSEDCRHDLQERTSAFFTRSAPQEQQRMCPEDEAAINDAFFRDVVWSQHDEDRRSFDLNQPLLVDSQTSDGDVAPGGHR